MNRILLALLLPFSLVSCATYQFQPVDQARESREAISVAALPSSDGQNRFEVTVTNGSAQAILVDGSRFRLYSGDQSRWAPVALVPNTEVYRRFERSDFTMSSVVVTERQPVYRQTTVIGGNGALSVTRIERRPVMGTTTIYTVDPDREARLARLKETLFFAANLEPGQSRTGWVYIPTSRAPFLKLVVPLDGKDYELVFERVKVPGVFMNLD